LNTTRAYGVDTEADYPYAEINTPETSAPATCRFAAITRQSVGTGYVEVAGFATTAGNEAALEAAVSSIGPISVLIQVPQGTAAAPDYTFFNYASGIYSSNDCNTAINHAVLAVGYGTNANGSYWIVKNSWSSGWGEAGYILIARNSNNMCFIGSYGTYPLLPAVAATTTTKAAATTTTPAATTTKAAATTTTTPAATTTKAAATTTTTTAKAATTTTPAPTTTTASSSSFGAWLNTVVTAMFADTANLQCMMTCAQTDVSWLTLSTETAIVSQLVASSAKTCSEGPAFIACVTKACPTSAGAKALTTAAIPASAVSYCQSVMG